ncbi:MAG: PAS domain S-box protein, partial [Coleofasciculus sp. S288]|nr:PAS domain S-box protein [Coleofasciculus sp. S288]
KQIEEALRQSEERLRVALQNAPITVFNQDCELKYTWIYNPVLYNLHEMLGKHDRDYLPPEDAEPLTAIKQRVLETGIGVRQEIKITRNETSYYYDLTVEPLRDNSSAIVGITCAAIDVSELKRTEFDLRESEARFRAIVNQATAGIAQTDLTGQFILVNQRYCNIVGYSMEELLQKRMQDITHPDDIPRNTELFQRMVTEGREFVIEKRYLRKDGSEVWVNNSVSVVRDKSGNPQSAVAVVLDVSDAHRQATQRKQVEEALRENEARLRMAIASAQLGTWDWNLVTGELKWDIGCKAMFGLPPDAESSIEVFFEGLHPDDRDRLQDVVQVSLNPASGGVYDTEYRTIGIQDNVERWIRAKGQAYFDAAGKPLRFIGTVLDITEQKQAAAQREQLLQREQVAREAAERANRIKDEFLAVLSHELRSPLNPILGWAKLLQTRQFDAQGTKRALQTIERNAKLQAQLIEDLLDVSRILRGKMVLNVCPVNLVTVVESALETVRLAAQAKQIQIQTVLSRENPEVSGDAARLQQIVWNLLSNAVKFTPDGGRVEVSLSLVNRHSSVEGSDALRTNNQGQMTKYAQIQVKDTGKGISPDFLPYVFDYFRQEDGKTTRKFGGLGLGLAIVRHLTELHGGTVHAESLGEGQGATFIVRLPLMSEATELAKENLTTAQFIDLSQLRILVVDDDEDMRELTQVILEQQGAQVIVAATAAEALRVFDRQPPDIFIGDIGMPEIDGYMQMQQIRSRSPEQGGLVSAIALTAYAGEYDQQQALHAGFQRHVAKPVEPEALVRAVADLVRNR